MSNLGDHNLRIRPSGVVSCETLSLPKRTVVHKRTTKLIVLYIPGHRYYGGLSSGGSYTPASFKVVEILSTPVHDSAESEIVLCRHIVEFDRQVAKVPTRSE